MNNRIAPLTLFALALGLFSAAPALADPILQPAGASSNLPNLPDFEPSQAINQSGLSTGYTSLVTDFDTYLAGNPTHNAVLFTNSWSGDGPPPGKL